MRVCLWMGSTCCFQEIAYIGIIWLQELDNQLPEPLPRPAPKEEDQSLVRRNKRMLGKLLVGTLEVTNSSDV